MSDDKEDNRITIRQARLGDEAGIASVHVRSWQTTYAGMMATEFLQNLSVTQRQEAWAANLNAAEDGRYVLVLEQAETIIGFVSGGANRQPSMYSRYDAEIYALYLLQLAQGRGYGRELIRQMAACLHEDGYRSAIVEALKENPAIQFYYHLGAERLGERTIKVGGTLHKEVTLGWQDLRMLLE
ncbi:GNAT family N-acetyltransferase [Paenibacillus bovis]|uniref:N-acetyltransferase domain-containing protein n=1 Tax=Paenibacillus bovis TaxID=1616788 RepID=A0A172ZGW8_9BACL|nr:GNAT family N-acetyltransferase [Paenibacillus bovis]ANF96773.1 hypothetical protein AR543_12640 [Paenibacillus bovis]